MQPRLASGITKILLAGMLCGSVVLTACHNPGVPPAGNGGTTQQSVLYVTNIYDGTISAFSIGTGGTLTQLANSPFAAGSTDLWGLAPNPGASRLYAGVTSGSGEVLSFSAAADGSLSPVSNSTVSAGAATEGLAISPQDTFLYAANAGSPSTISGYSINASGGLAQLTSSPYSDGNNQPFSLAVTPNGEYIYAADEVLASGGRISGYQILSDGSLRGLSGSPFSGTTQTGECASRIAISPDGTYLFSALIEGSSAGSPIHLQTFSIASTGALSLKSDLTLSMSTAPFAIAVTPNGKFLYLSSPSDYAIWAYTIGSGGALSRVTGSPFPAYGDSPGPLIVSPDSSYLYVGNQGASGVGRNLVGYSIASDGSLAELPSSPYPIGSIPQDMAILTR